MKTQFSRFFILSFAFLVFSASAFAQSGSIKSVEIPFNFNIGNEKLSAGKYQVSRVSDSSFLFRNETGKVTVLAQTPYTIGDLNEADAEKLIFNRYGDKYFLRQIFSVRNTVGRGLFESKTEKIVRKGLQDKEEIVKKSKPSQVAVSLKNN